MIPSMIYMPGDSWRLWLDWVVRWAARGEGGVDRLGRGGETRKFILCMTAACATIALSHDGWGGRLTLLTSFSHMASYWQGIRTDYMEPK